MITNEEIVGIFGIVATVIIGIVSWIVSAVLTKKQLTHKEIKYQIKMIPLLDDDKFKEMNKLKIEYKGQRIETLMYVELDIYNTGNCAIENPPMKIHAKDFISIIPAYIEDIPDGYESLWKITQDENEFDCSIQVDHINPKQVLKARFLLDAKPESDLIFTCPVPNLQLLKISEKEFQSVAGSMLEILSPTAKAFSTILIGGFNQKK